MSDGRKPTHTIESIKEAARRHPYTRAFYWSSSEYDAASYIGGASFFAVRTSKALFGVTANHAVEEFLARTVIGAQPRLFNYSFDLPGRIIARSSRWDVATFSLTGLEANRMVIEPLKWPPTTPAQGRGVVVCGVFAARERVEVRPGEIAFDKVCHLLLASHVAADRIEVEVDTRVVTPPERQFDIRDIPHGFSGSPLLTVTCDNHPLTLGGVVTRYRLVDEYRACFEAMPVAACIHEDGTIVDG